MPWVGSDDAAPHAAPSWTAGSPALRFKRRVFGMLPRRWRLPLRVRWMQLTRTLEPEVQELERLVPPGGLALDIGANHGVYSYFMVRHFDRVVAFEPQPACASTLTDWAGDRVDVREVALSDRVGEGTLSIPVASGVALTGYARLGGPDGDDGASTIQVPLERLDDQGLTEVQFVKIDVEGHELSVLVGGDELIRRDRPVLLVEIEQRHLRDDRTVADVVGHLTDRGYDCRFRESGCWVPFDRFRPVTHQDTTLLGGPGYVGMFLFLPVADPPGAESAAAQG